MTMSPSLSINDKNEINSMFLNLAQIIRFLLQLHLTQESLSTTFWSTCCLSGALIGGWAVGGDVSPI